MIKSRNHAESPSYPFKCHFQKLFMDSERAPGTYFQTSTSMAGLCSSPKSQERRQKWSLIADHSIVEDVAETTTTHPFSPSRNKIHFYLSKSFMLPSVWQSFFCLNEVLATSRIVSDSTDLHRSISLFFQFPWVLDRIVHSIMSQGCVSLKTMQR